MRTFTLVFSLALLACGEPSDSVVAACVEQCDAAGDCPGGTGNCLDTCESDRAFAKEIDCSAEYEAIIACNGELTDVCDVAACDTELSVYLTCFGEFCGLEPEHEACEAPPE